MVCTDIKFLDGGVTKDTTKYHSLESEKPLQTLFFTYCHTMLYYDSFVFRPTKKNVSKAAVRISASLAHA